MFKTSCSNVKLFKDSHGTRWWSGATCEGGGSECWHKMNEDLMTPVAVAHEVGHVRAMQAIKAIMRKAEEEANEAAFSFYNVELWRGVSRCPGATGSGLYMKGECEDDA